MQSEVRTLTDRFDRTPRRSQRHAGTGRHVMAAVVLCAGVLSASTAAGCAQADANTQSGSISAPVIQAVTVVPERIQPGDTCQMACEATAGNVDILTYSWTASEGDIAGEGPNALWTAPGTEGLFRVSVTVDDGNGGSDTQSLSLTVRYNAAPEFQFVPTYTEGVRPGASVSISCPAVDADGDEITYQWHASYGEIRGEGEEVSWVAPRELGSYVVTVRARDAYGGEATRDVLITVTPSPTPRLGDFVVEALGHNMLKQELGVWDIYIGESCHIECVVAEGDGPFSYAWTVDEGVLTADGAVATWQAPETRGPATIAVAVTDALGNTNSAQLLMYAEDCTCAFN